jgi:hypothetical protein
MKKGVSLQTQMRTFVNPRTGSYSRRLVSNNGAGNWNKIVTRRVFRGCRAGLVVLYAEFPMNWTYKQTSMTSREP